MATWVVLLRGVNVGGKNKLKMAPLRELLAAAGFAAVRSHLQSGNLVLESELDADEVGAGVADAIEEEHGFRPEVLALSVDELSEALAANPYAEEDPRRVQLFFLAESAADADLEPLEALRAKSEAFTLGEGVFYLHAPDGIGRSKLAARAERVLGVAATARNLRTASALLELVRG